MRSFFFIFFLALANNAFALESSCSCHNDSNMWQISRCLELYKDKAENKYLWEMPPLRERWQSAYHTQFKSHLSLYPNSRSMRYPDVYQRLLLYEQRLDFLANFCAQNLYEQYLGVNHIYWGLKKEERESQFEQQKKYLLDKKTVCKIFLSDCSSKIFNAYIDLYEGCLSKQHNNFITLYDYGLFSYLNNNLDKSFELLSELLNVAEKSNRLDTLDTTVYHKLGSIYSEAMAYDKAIEYLTESIQKDPNNKEAYFERALAYFETESFDLAINDYSIARKEKKDSEKPLDTSDEFTKALLLSLANGAQEAVVDFVPSFFNTAYGIGQSLWSTIQSPIESTQNFVEACYDMGECVSEYYKDFTINTVDGYVVQMAVLCNNYEQLTPSERGELIGYTIGKYGVDIFIGAGSIKAVSAYRNLKNANTACNLEALALSESRESIECAALLHASKRKNFFSSVEIHWDKQNKHIPGKHNYIEGKGKIFLEREELEFLLKENAGKGQHIKGEFGQAGYKERVDFGKIIGEYAYPSPKGIEYVSTTNGVIHYDKNGFIHVVPSDPKLRIL